MRSKEFCMDRSVVRRTALAAFGSVGAAAFVRRTAFAQTAPLKIGLLPIFDVAPFYAAQQQGYFAAEGVKVEAQVVRGGAAGLAALASGSIDVLYTNPPSAVLAISRGIDLRLILQGIALPRTPPDPGALVRRKDDNLRTGKDLEGKVVAVNGIRDLAWMFVTAWIKKTGGDPEKVQMLELGMAAQAEALKAKRVDAAMLLEPFMTAALGDPAIEILDWTMSKTYADGPGAFYVVTPQFGAQHLAEIRAFVSAYKRGADWVNANFGKEPVFSLIASFSGTPLDLVRRIKMPPANAQILVGNLTHVTDLMTYTGVATGGVDLRTKILT
jgi:NitT/TauT family transport system substrate-binding protein